MSQSGSRYNRTFPGMIGAMVVCLLAIAAFVAFRASVREDLEVAPEPVEWASSVRYAQENDLSVAYPAALPEDWIVRKVDLSLGRRPVWGLSMLTDSGQYAGIRQERASVDRLVSALIDEEAEMGEPVTLEGALVEEWSTFTDAGGDYALVAELDGANEGQALMVFGTADEDELRDLATSLTFDPKD